jgi:hypothetical protein
MAVESINREYHKPPIKLFGFVIYCRHVWAIYWKPVAEDVDEGVLKCKRCLKEKLQ